MLAHQQSTCGCTPHPRCLKPINLPCISTSNAQPAWRTVGHTARHARKELLQGRHMQHATRLWCHAGQLPKVGVMVQQQAPLTMTAPQSTAEWLSYSQDPDRTAHQPAVEWLSYSQDPEKAEACIQAIASALAADPLAAKRLEDAKQHIIGQLRMLLNFYPTVPQLVVASDGGGVCGALCHIMPRDVKPVVYAEWIKDFTIALEAVKLTSLVHFIWGADAHEKQRDSFIKENGGRALRLSFFGTDPAHQNRGLGSAVLKELVTHADKLQLPMVLNSSTSRSAALYARHGFSVLAEDPHGVSGTLMARLPRPIQGHQMPMGQGDIMSVSLLGAEMEDGGRETAGGNGSETDAGRQIDAATRHTGQGQHQGMLPKCQADTPHSSSAVPAGLRFAVLLYALVLAALRTYIRLRGLCNRSK